MKTNDALLYKVTRPIITFLFKTLFWPKIEGKENIPLEGKVVLAGNHTSILDCLLLISSTKRNIHFLAKKELWQGPKKIIFNHMGLIPVDRKVKSSAPLVMAESYLRDNKVIGIFPEGTTEKQRKGLLPFKIGAVKMAKATDSYIVPFCITGKYKLFSKDLKIVFGKKMKVTENDLEVANARLKDKIESLLRSDK